jgi:hypothetical protein
LFAWWVKEEYLGEGREGGKNARREECKEGRMQGGGMERIPVRGFILVSALCVGMRSGGSASTHKAEPRHSVTMQSLIYEGKFALILALKA